MSVAEARRKIAVVLPNNRVWQWHAKLISALKVSFEVDVYSNGKAPPYPRYVAVWLHLEKWLLGEFDLVDLIHTAAMPWRQCVDVAYCLILNLSEEPILCQDAPIIELRYQGTQDSLDLLATLLNRQNPYLSFHLNGREEPIVASYLAIPDRVVLARCLQCSFARLLALAEDATKRLVQGTRAATLPELPKEDLHVFSPATMFRFCLRFILDKLFCSVVRRFQIKEHWSIALLPTVNLDLTIGLSVQKHAIVSDDGKRYYADPFLFADAGRTWLFFEELRYETGKGVISCAQVKNDGQIGASRTVLERPYHLSYPFVFRHCGKIYMIPETGDNNTVELYRAQSFPFTWEPHLILLENIALYDATLLQYQNRLWLFAAISRCGNAPHDELAIFYSERLEGPWQPHRLNPVKSDCRSARPAGRLITRDKRLLRAAQDCESGYGSALVWCEIHELTPERFDEREVCRWYPDQFSNANNGLHTFDCDDGLGVIDIKRTVWRNPFHVRKESRFSACISVYS
jgi:hypothetical protein